MSLEPWPTWPNMACYIVGHGGLYSKNSILAESIQANTRIQELQTLHIQEVQTSAEGSYINLLELLIHIYIYTYTMYTYIYLYLKSPIFIRMMWNYVEFVYENDILMRN